MKCSLIRWLLPLSSFARLFLSRLHSWLKPNFSAHWGNWVLAPVIAFFLGYLPSVSFAADYQWCQFQTSNCASDPSIVANNIMSQWSAEAESVSTSSMVYVYEFGDSYYKSDERYAFRYTYYWESSGIRQYMAQNNEFDQILRSACTEAQKNDPSSPCYDVVCPDPGTLYSGELIGGSVGSGFTDPDGCSVVPNYKPTYCDYAGAEDQECLVLDGYKYGETTPPPPKTCRDSGGRFIGQVSANVECPVVTKTKCYNPDGTLAYLADSPSHCPVNTSPDNSPDKQSDTDSDIDPETGEPTGDKTNSSTTTTETTVTQNPDGSTTTTTTTTTTNSDGSTSTSTTSKTEYPDGTTSETTDTEQTEPATSVTGGMSCDVEPSCDGDPLQCYQIKQQWRDSCHKNESLQGFNCADPKSFQCSGGPLECYSLRLQHEAACIRGDKSAAEQAVSDAIARGDIDFDGTDEWGQLKGLDNGEFNVSEEFDVASLWVDNGNAGSCPAPAAFSVLGKSYEISFQPLCDLAGYLRPLVILMAMWISGSMLSQTLVGTRYTI